MLVCVGDGLGPGSMEEEGGAASCPVDEDLILSLGGSFVVGSIGMRAGGTEGSCENQVMGSAGLRGRCDFV